MSSTEFCNWRHVKVVELTSPPRRLRSQEQASTNAVVLTMKPAVSNFAEIRRALPEMILSSIAGSDEDVESLDFSQLESSGLARAIFFDVRKAQLCFDFFKVIPLGTRHYSHSYHPS